MTWNASLIDGPITIDAYDQEQVGGYHLNCHPIVNRQTDTGGLLDAFVIMPLNPRRIWLGAETMFLKFADEAEAKLHLSDYWTDQ
jgi:hypothetical protein